MALNPVVLIPAYNPGEALVRTVRAIRSLSELIVVVVDDGSTPEHSGYFESVAAAPDVHLIRHAVNLGKGAALKTGLNHIAVQFPGCPVVTADADGQHDPEDIIRVANRVSEHPDALVLGVRSFKDTITPLRSRIGNDLTCLLMKILVGQKLADTQTGLRGIPSKLIPHLLRIQATGYEFELDMLIACKHGSISVWQEPIRTIYVDGNRRSHFHPLFDSMRIYLLLFRFSMLSLLTAALDNAVFILAFSITGSIGRSQLISRSGAMVFNYLGARSVVFHSQQRHAIVLPRFVLLVACNGLLSYALIQLQHNLLAINVVSAKLLAEGFLFIGNFAVQRDFVFTRRTRPTATDWSRYYKSVPATANLTRKYTTAVLVDAVGRFVKRRDSGGVAIMELGGANSCFLDAIMTAARPSSYDVVDTNEYGLSLLAKRAPAGDVVRVHRQNVLDLSCDRQADLVFSVGLVEHFAPPETRKAVMAHFEPLQPGGIAMISFPTPTLLYRVSRKFIELVGMWKFPDERPLDPAEVLASVSECGDVLYQKTLWPLMLTQHFVVARKR